MGALNRLKNAFAVDPPGPAEPTRDQKETVDRICREVARRHLTVPALIFSEMSRPLNYVGAQALHMLSPAVWALAQQQGHERYKSFIAFLEQRGSVDYIISRIEHFEEELDRRQRERKSAPGSKATEATSARDAIEEDHDQD